MHAWNLLRQLLAAALCAVLALPAFSTVPLSSSTLNHAYDTPSVSRVNLRDGEALSRTPVSGSNEQILLHFRAVRQLSGELQWSYAKHTGKKAVRSVVTYDYDAFGNLLHSTGTTPNNYLFAGEQFDPDLNLYYNRARYLNTGTGRFWSMDTAEGDDNSPVSLHKYLNVGANPVDRTDTSGNGIDELIGSLGVMATLDTISLLNFDAVLKGLPKEETLYVRSFAPWDWFGAEPPICANNCFRGNNRSFTTSRDKSVTSKVTGIVKFLLPTMTLVGTPTAYSDVSRDVYGRAATGQPTISVNAAGDGKLHMEFAGANPLVPSPDIDTKLDISAQVKSGQACYSGHLYGDAFPNAEAFVVNSHDQAAMLLTFATTGGRNTGPLHFLPGNNNRDMGSFSSKCLPE